MNNTIFFFFYNLAHQSKIFNNIVIFFAVYFPFVVVILGVFFLLFYRRSWKEFFMVFLSSGVAWIFSYVLKILIHLPRPFLALSNVNALFNESGFAFPSGHATFFSALAFAIFFLNKKAGYVFIFFAVLIGLARIVAGVHFPVDILGGFLLGFTISYVLSYIFNYFSNHFFRKL